ncbi:hypothetical protein [Aquabacter cavernae]|uniref:hypothetical protein n=1 Tax=Aquabacter cavernae TaxID=2496029 RepID=UPI000F8F1135|nr:hypothetical protein [Aquabacter cavernae]
MTFPWSVLFQPAVWLVAALSLGAGWLGGHVAGSSAARLRCDADALRVEVQVLGQRLATIDTALAADAVRAVELQTPDLRNQKAVNETPPNDAACLDRAAAGRVRTVR